jgi:hypothetical protein
MEIRFTRCRVADNGNWVELISEPIRLEDVYLIDDLTIQFGYHHPRRMAQWAYEGMIHEVEMPPKIELKPPKVSQKPWIALNNKSAWLRGKR